MATGSLFYARHQRTYVLKLVGELRYTLGEALNAFLDRLFKQEDFDRILIDLTEAVSIDSTILGLLAKVANFMGERFGRKPILVSTNADINQLLDSVGFYEVFIVAEQLDLSNEGLRPLSVPAPSEEAMAATLLEAHTLLSELNEDNRLLFKDVVEALREKNS
jgi:anti-anti-sigma factor